MKFVLEIDLGEIEGDAAAELGRALRYWGGATKQLDLTMEYRQEIYDSSYAKPIGYWELQTGEGIKDVSSNQHSLD